MRLSITLIFALCLAGGCGSGNDTPQRDIRADMVRYAITEAQEMDAILKAAKTPQEERDAFSKFVQRSLNNRLGLMLVLYGSDGNQVPVADIDAAKARLAGGRAEITIGVRDPALKRVINHTIIDPANLFLLMSGE